jgi:hypothetical protein
MHPIRTLIIACLALFSLNAWAEPVGTSFTYQGELISQGVPANGAYDFQFDLYAVATDGSPIATTVEVEDVAVVEGIFTVILDFGPGVFTDEQRWLEIAVRDGDSIGEFSLLEPRQLVSAAPFAQRALEGTISQLVCADGEILIYDGPSSTWGCGDASSSITSNSITVNEIDTTSVQARVSGDCEVGSLIRQINEDGTVVCEQDATLSESEVDEFVSDNNYSTGPHTIDTDTACDLSGCVGLGRATLTCGNVSISVHCERPQGIWTSQTAPTGDWTSVTYGAGLFVAVALDDTNSVMTSPDGSAWTVRSVPESNNWKSVTYGNGLFVSVASNGTNRVMTSPDGINWTARSAAEANEWNSVTYGDGLFVAVADSGTNRVMTSPDGITWTSRSASEDSVWVSVTHGNGLFVAVAFNGANKIMTSEDGITWLSRNDLGVGALASVTYGGGLFVIVGGSPSTDQVLTSTDGINWTKHSSAENNSWRGVTYGGGSFVAVSRSGNYRSMTSPDGINWTARITAEDNDWESVTYGNGLFVAVSRFGTNRVMTTPGE